MIHYGVCKAGHAQSGCMTLPRWKKLWKAKTYAERVKHAIRRYIIERQINILRCHKLTELLKRRVRESA